MHHFDAEVAVPHFEKSSKKRNLNLLKPYQQKE
jgi:hypothetical protein